MKKRQTGWSAMAQEYGGAFFAEDSYHANVIMPNLLRVVAPKKGARILDVGCGDGSIPRAFAETGASVQGVDVAPDMVREASRRFPDGIFEIASADKLPQDEASVDTVVCTLALQNIENLQGSVAEAARVLVPGGSYIIVLNHPAFRIPKRSSWGWDDGVQFRRLDGYLSERREKIDMDPGRKTGKRFTYSFHRPLQVYVKALVRAGFTIDGLEEWISHRQSERGPRAHAEDFARKEFPLFLMLKARKVA